MIRCDMCHKPLKSKRHQIVRGSVTLTVGPDCFKKEKQAAEHLKEMKRPEYQDFTAWLRANKGGARPCPAGNFPHNFKFWMEGGRW